MQTICDKCKKSVKQVGRLTNTKWKGVSQKLCKECKKKLKISYR
jgi:predicted SprT family Zn-dependent metalloprotease